MSINIEEPQWKYVELGRVAFINQGPAAGKLAAIVEIIDHKRVCLPFFCLPAIKDTTGKGNIEMEAFTGKV